jgi:hypothetical protein
VKELQEQSDEYGSDSVENLVQSHSKLNVAEDVITENSSSPASLLDYSLFEADYQALSLNAN